MLGHYFFYHSLDGQPTPDADYNIWGDSFSVSGQQGNIGIGSLFALLVKTMLGLAIVTALDQVTWRQIREEPTKVATVDDVLSIPTALFSLANLKLWRRYPQAILTGIILWLLSIISVIAPATLTVRSTSYSETSAERVPHVDFASLKLARFGKSENGVSFGGDILSIIPPFPNSSWHLDFDGPALDYHNLDQSFRNKIIENVKVNNNCSDGTVYGYLSWVRTAYDWEGQFHQVTVPDTIVPFDKDTGTLQTVTLGPAYASSDYGTAPLTLYVAAFPGMLKRTYAYKYWDEDNCPKPSTFVANLDKINGEYLNTAEARMNAQYKLNSLSYQAILDAPGRVLVGTIGLAQRRMPAGVMSAPIITHGLNMTDTTVMSTVIASASELAFLSSYIQDNGPVDPAGGLSTTVRSIAERSLPELIEEVFENITLSMMSSDSLQFNYSSRLAPDNVPVTTTQIVNLYSFSKSVLWITYGVALLLTLGVGGVGLHAHVSSHGSYTTKFSTIFRTTRGATLSTSIEATDENGQDPLPMYIAKSTIALAGATGADSNDGVVSGASGSDRRRLPSHAAEQRESDE
ncbi:hypothetical protein BDV38DRAFT_285292 [Aspergillus pseudotamarii]|uniref:Uncharacterized protein n=1 Tax=Aspergillus pseudotamarii TaxID=132259 RepID=A0A5N6SMU1_ASPPS|nr:uncharacterized protein BDV38DRAFT_285292 [Aspergillus pseudotamarii]KAE8135090.1 hypothetical protein BDV38DRAFT_285292 [Aspergillus pseudotamarii]